jgi:hypothetical protein
MQTTKPSASFAFSLPAALVRLEGLTVFITAIVLYASLGANGWLFLLLLLAPDFSAIGYALGTRIGALSYNAAHTYVSPLLLVAISVVFNWETGLPLALIWFAQIGMDRTVGYGLKYASGFKDTHLGRL